MKTINCRDISGEECDFSITAENAEEAKRSIHDHIQEAHTHMGEPEIQQVDNEIDHLFAS